MDSSTEIRFVLASANLKDEADLRALLTGTPWTFVRAASLQNAVALLHEIALPIVVLDRDLDARPWRENFSSIRKSRRRACVILLGDSNGPRPDEMLRLGGLDVLSRPIHREELCTALICAYSQARMRWLSFTRVQAIPAIS